MPALPTPADAVELEDLRGPFRKVWRANGAPDGRFLAGEATGAIHFRERGSFRIRDIDDDLVTQDAGGVLESWEDGITFGVDLGGGLTIAYRSREIVYRPATLRLLDRSNGRQATVSSATYSRPERVAANVWRMVDLFPGVDWLLTFGLGTVKERFVIRQDLGIVLPGNLNPTTAILAVVYAVQGSASLRRMDGSAIGSPYAGQEALYIDDGAGAPLLYLPAPAGSSTSTRFRYFPLWYARLAAGGIDVAVGVDWVRYAGAAAWGRFPIVLDPTVSEYISTTADDGMLIDGSPVDGLADGAQTGASYNVIGRLDDAGKGETYEYRGYWRFGLSGYAGYICNSASFYGYVVSAEGTPGTSTLKLYTTDWGTLTLGDWGQAGTDQGSLLNPASGAYRQWTCIAADIEGKFGGVASFEMRSNAGAGLNWFGINDYTAGSNKPYLFLDYSVAGGVRAWPAGGLAYLPGRRRMF